MKRALVMVAAGLALMPVAAMAAAPVAAPAFDVDAATRLYLDSLQGPARAQSDAYFEGGYWLILWGTLVALLSDGIILRSGVSARLRDWAERVTRRRFLQAMVWTAPYVVAGAILTAPWVYYTQYVREKSYGLLTQDFGPWLSEAGISFAVNLVVMMIALPLVWWGIRASPRRWWLWGAGAAAAFMAVIVAVSPVFISPLFNDYTEMQGGAMRDRIVAMAQSQNVPAEHIYVFDQSRQHKRISANVSGLGPTIRISLNDNLLERTSPPEVAAVMGHELGHYVLNHIWKLLAMVVALFVAMFWLAWRAVPWIIGRWGGRWQLRGVDDLAALPVYFMVLNIAGMMMTPLFNNMVRYNESAADAFGLDVAREPDGFANVAMRLSEYRKIEPTRLEEFLFYDHPSGATRVRMAMEWKARHVPNATIMRPLARDEE